ADTSSAAAGTTPVIGAAAAAFWTVIAEPILCKWATAAANNSGCVVTNDMNFLLCIQLFRVSPEAIGARCPAGAPRSDLPLPPTGSENRYSRMVFGDTASPVDAIG